MTGRNHRHEASVFVGGIEFCACGHIITTEDASPAERNAHEPRHQAPEPHRHFSYPSIEADGLDYCDCGYVERTENTPK